MSIALLSFRNSWVLQGYSFYSCLENARLFICFCWRLFALKLHAKTTPPASRGLEENDIDVYVHLDSPARLWKRWHLRNRNEFLIWSQWSISSEGSRFRISRTYDTYWIWPIVGEKKDGSTSPIFMLFFSTLVKRLVYDEQQRIQATFLKFWMPLSLFQRLSRLFEVADSPQARHSVPEKVGENFSSRQPLILLLTCFFTRQCWQIA